MTYFQAHCNNQIQRAAISLTTSCGNEKVLTWFVGTELYRLAGILFPSMESVVSW